MMKTKQKTYWWIDSLLFTGFLLAFFLSFTGIELHQWIGIFGGLLALYHLLIHSDWVDAVSKRLFTNVSGNVLLKYIVDGLLLVGFILIILTGLVISTWLGVSLNNYTSWLTVHIIASITTLLALMVKLALHWRWIAKTTRTIVIPSVPMLAKSLQLQPVPVEKRSMDRRDFLKVCGIAGGASLIAMLSATRSLAALQGEEGSTSTQAETNNSSSYYINQSGVSQSSSDWFSSSDGCSVQCGRRCSYPGQCRRYTDSNNNNRCDFGECA
jgi:hypothetical protein